MLRELLLQNPWWTNPNKINEDTKVKLATANKTNIRYHFLKKNSILLGQRQVGKTTYLKLYIRELIKNNINEKNITYFSCEPLTNKNDLIELFYEITKISPENGKKYLFLDEITAVSDWEKAVKYLLEQKIISNFQLICTGSNAHFLKEGIERFPGRDIKTILFLPLTFAEYSKQITQKKIISKPYYQIKEIYNNCKKLFPQINEINKSFKNYAKSGGIPKSIFELKKNNNLSSETYELYVNWILGGLAKFGKRESIFRPLIKGIVESYTSKISLNALAKDFQIQTHSTVETYLELLNQLLLVNILHSVDPQKKIAQFRKNKKIYFQDPFLYSVFKGYTYGKYQDYSKDNMEKVVEGILCQELAALKRTKPEINNHLWYFHTKKETDFVMLNQDKSQSLIGIELKWSSKPSPADFNNRFTFKERIILTKDKLDYDKEKKIYLIPTALFLLSLPSTSKVYL